MAISLTNLQSSLNGGLKISSKASSSFISSTRSLLILSSMLVFAFMICSGLEAGYVGDSINDLHQDILRDVSVARLTELGKISDAENYLKRTFLSPASMKAINLIRQWMEDAGLTTWVDGMGNVHGRAGGMNASSETLIIGSHLDTVVDAGIFDGSLGIVSALSALKVLHISGELKKLRQPVEDNLILCLILTQWSDNPRCFNGKLYGNRGKLVSDPLRPKICVGLCRGSH